MQPDTSENTAQLKRFIDDKVETLLATLRVYVLRAGLVRGQPVDVVAVELLSEVTIEALSHAGRFDPKRQPMAWLLGIAANLICRKQVDLAKRERREPLVRDLYPDEPDGSGEDELFDQLADWAAAGPDQQVEAQERMDGLLAELSESDRQIVRLYVLHNLSGDATARVLGITPGAARVRLHRALGRLRKNLAAEATI